MRNSPVFWLGLIGVGSALGGWASGCSGGTDAADWNDGGAGGGSGNTHGGLCTPCVTNNDCGGGVCAQFQGDTYCAPSCANGASCGSGATCSIESSANGEQVSVCVPNGNACGPTVGPQSDGGPPRSSCDAGGGTGNNPDKCGSLVGPTVSAGCHSCSSSSSNCQPNGCYGGWWCDTTTTKCQAPPANCSGGGGGSSGGCAAGGGGGSGGSGGGGGGTPVGPVSGTVGPNGGSVSRLYFTVVGDTRPANDDDTAGYPTAIIQKIYADIAAMNPPSSFNVGTGDYMFATPSGGQASPQLDQYLAARGQYSGTFFPAMGNHECTGATASNCGPNGTDGVTDNLTQFTNKLLGPVNQTQPYYSFNVNATDNSWTAKFVLIAANAWDSNQASWLQTAMGQQTTYTFVVRHEATEANTAPGVSPSDQIVQGFPYTLMINGHTHTYEHYTGNSVIIGNGGAPLTGSGNYGYALFSQQSDGSIAVDMIDYQSLQPDPSFHFAVKADGSAAP